MQIMVTSKKDLVETTLVVEKKNSLAVVTAVEAEGLPKGLPLTLVVIGCGLGLWPALDL